MVRLALMICFVLVQATTLWADVLVYDSVAVPGTPVMLKARTGGRFLAKGGELVDFSVAGEQVGRTLSGGDGMAYLEYTPGRAGLLEVKASSGGDDSTGALLVFSKKNRAVIVEVAGSLTTGDFLPMPRQGGASAMEKLLESYRVIYISGGLLGAAGDRAWLEKNEFPRSVVLEWKGGRALKRIESLGVRVRAIVGSAGFIQIASRSKDVQLFSFDPEAEDGRVGSWDEVLKELLP